METRENAAGAAAMKAERRSPWGLIVGLGLWSTVVSLATGYGVWHLQSARLAQELAIRPPVAIVNGAEWALTAGEGATPAEQVDSGIRQFNDAVTKLANAGFMVVDARWVPAAPANVVVDTPHANAAVVSAKPVTRGQVTAGESK